MKNEMVSSKKRNAKASADSKPIWKVELMPIEKVIPYARNPRRNENAVAKVAGSIKEFGFRQPIVVDKEMVIIVGHTRLLAAQQLELKEVPVHIAENLTPAQIKAYRIADNRTNEEAEWDDELLSLELGELRDSNFDLDITGFDPDELEQFLEKESFEGLSDEDEVPEVQEKVVTLLGDTWVCGEHRLICGDATDKSVLEKLLKGELAEMIFTDPPWNLNYGDVREGNPQGYKARRILNDNMGEDEWLQFCKKITAAMFASSKPGAIIYVVMGPNEWPTFDTNLREAGFHWSSTIIWAKDHFVFSRKDYHTQYEPIWYGWNESGARLCPLEDRKQSDLWEVERHKTSELHPTMKPVELVQRALENSSKSGDIILDCFGGSGSTLIACEKVGRSARLLELDPKYCDVIIRRWEEFTGKKALLEGSGESFAELETKRAASQ